MKTPQQIIDALPEGNRKRACVILKHSTGDYVSAFWAFIDCAEYGKAASLLEDEAEPKETAQVLADMIWEG